MGNSGVLRVELDRLAGLGPILRGLADEAASLRTGPSAGPYLSVPGGMEPAVLEASSIAHDLVDTTLVTTVKDRLSETGQIMVDVANQYRSADEATTKLTTVMTTYSNATGTWDVPEAPK
ncbi:MAG TPA: hypothetical protein VIO95_13385 [Mycobacterium sp.]